MQKEVCEVILNDPDVVERVKKQMEPAESLHSLADLFKVLGDPTRIKLLTALTHSELCVCALADILEMGSSAVSHQLRVLRGAKLVKSRREGKNVVYSLDDDHVRALMEQGLDHVMER